MKVIVFGASGETGRLVVTSGLQQLHGITAFVRDPSKLRIQHKSLTFFQGDVSNYKSVESALEGHDAVISALGASTPFKKNPIIVDGIANIVNAMKRQKVSRLIYQSFVGVREFRSELGFLLDKVVPIALNSVIKDHEAKERNIMQSDLLWTIVRCSMLTNGEATGNYRIGEHIKPSSLMPTISRADVADFVIKQLTDNQYYYKKPRLMY
jgi:putative NADH-flavin reductase